MAQTFQLVQSNIHTIDDLVKLPKLFQPKDYTSRQGKASLRIQHHSDTRQLKVLYRGTGNTLEIRFKENIRIKI